MLLWLPKWMVTMLTKGTFPGFAVVSYFGSSFGLRFIHNTLRVDFGSPPFPLELLIVRAYWYYQTVGVRATVDATE
jgi:hypothetical protein